MTKPSELKPESTTYLLRGSLAGRAFAAVRGTRLEVLALSRNRWNLQVVDAQGQSVGAPIPVPAEEVTAFARCGSRRLVVGAVEGQSLVWLLDDEGALLSERAAPIRTSPVCVDVVPFGVDVGYRHPTVVTILDLTGDQPQAHFETTLEGRTHEHAITDYGTEIVFVRAGAAARPVEVWFFPTLGDDARHISIPGTEGAVAPGVVQVGNRLAVLWATQGATQTVMLQWIHSDGELDGTAVELVRARHIVATFAVWASEAGLAVGYTTRAPAGVHHGPGPRIVGRHAYLYDTCVATCDTTTGQVSRFLHVSGSERECHWVDGKLLALSGENCDLKVTVLLPGIAARSQNDPGS